MNTCFTNCQYVYKEDHHFKLFKGNIIVSNGRIISFDYSVPADCDVVDMHGNLLLPMFVDLQCPCRYNFYEGLDGNWDIEKYELFTNKFNGFLLSDKPEAFEASSDLTVHNVVKNGIGAICSTGSFNILKKAPLFVLSAYPVINLRPFDKFISRSSYQKALIDSNSQNMVTGFDLNYICDLDENGVNFVQDNITKKNFIKVNIAEEKLSMSVCKQKWRCSELEFLKKMKLLSDKTLLIGANLLTNDEINQIKNANASLVLCPVNNILFKNETPNIDMIQDSGVHWCIGSGGIPLGRTNNMIYQIQELKRIEPHLCRHMLLKSITTRPMQIFEKLTNSSFNGFANFSVVKTDKDFKDMEDILDFLFSEDPNNLEFELYINGFKMEYENTISIEPYKDYLRKFYKQFDEFLTNSNYFLSKINKY